MKKKITGILSLTLLVAALTACGAQVEVDPPGNGGNAKAGVDANLMPGSSKIGDDLSN